MNIRLPVETKDKPIASLGQIRPGSPFGNMLTELARKSEVIVETGTWRGLGTTYCLYLGLERPTQHLYTVELNRSRHLEAKSYYDDPRITFIHGTLVLPNEVPKCPPEVNKLPGYAPQYAEEVEWNSQVPYVLDLIPKEIDLLLIDSGFWAGRVEYEKLGPRAKIIALDDTNPGVEVKNVHTRKQLIDAGWKVLADRLDDRNGWFVAQRPS